MSKNIWLWIEDVENVYGKASHLSTKPDKKFKKIEEGHIFDEEKSVKWNREEVIRINNEYKAEEDRLKAIKNQALEDAKQEIYKYISQETNFSEEQASLIWEYAYNKFGYSSGYKDAFEELDEIIELCKKLQNLQKVIRKND